MDINQQLADMQAAMRALWPDRPKVYFVPGQGDDAPVLTDEERGQLHRVTLAIADARTPVDTGPSPADLAVKRVEALAETWEARARRYAAADDRDKVTDLRQRASALRAALASPAPAPQGESS